MIPYGRQHITDADIEAVEKVLRSDWLTQGPAAPNFEQAAADRVRAKYAVAVSNATSALHIACRALSLKPGDSLWTSPNTFVASANCARYCGAEVDFVDIDPRTYNLSPEALSAKLKEAASRKKLPKIVVPVHFAGQSCDMRAIHALSQEYGFKIIEDASHAIGGTYLDSRVGSCLYSDVTVFSFHPVKIITTGEGGLALTNDRDLAERMRLLRSHGITRDPGLMAGHQQEPWYYQQIDLGFNYRMTDLQAALGLSQLELLDAFLGRRRQIAAAYDRQLRELPVICPYQSPDARSSLHLYPIKIDAEASKLSRAEVFSFLRSRDIGVNVHYIPVYRQPYYQELGFKKGCCPEAERYYESAISLPIYYGLTDDLQDQVVAALKDAFA